MFQHFQSLEQLQAVYVEGWRIFTSRLHQLRLADPTTAGEMDLCTVIMWHPPRGDVSGRQRVFQVGTHNFQLLRRIRWRCRQQPQSRENHVECSSDSSVGSAGCGVWQQTVGRGQLCSHGVGVHFWVGSWELDTKWRPLLPFFFILETQSCWQILTVAVWGAAFSQDGLMRMWSSSVQGLQSRASSN